MSPDAAHSDASASAVGGNRQQLFRLCEAIDLVISAQGYNSPAVPPLLHAMIGTVRLLRAAPEPSTGPAAGGAEKADREKVAAGLSEAAPGPADAQAKAKTEDAEGVAAPADPRGTEPPPSLADLDHRIAVTDRKIAALSEAVGRLIEHLERRRWTISPAERRAEMRLPGIDAAVYIDRRRYRVMDWSKSGFCIQVGDGELLGRRRLAFRFTLELLDETIEFQGHAMPVRREGDRLAARFVQLDRAVAAKLAEVVRRLAGDA